MAVRPVSAELPEMLIIWCRVFRLRQAIQVEQRGCQSREDDGQVI
jgi:hypothetical protein